MKSCSNTRIYLILCALIIASSNILPSLMQLACIRSPLERPLAMSLTYSVMVRDKASDAYFGIMGGMFGTWIKILPK